MKKVIIFDMDGTLCAISEERKKLIEAKDWDGFHRLAEHEKVIEPVKCLLQQYIRENANIVISTGRPDRYREMTQNWLKEKNIQYNILCMRHGRDPRHSYEIKEEVADYYKTQDAEIIVVEDRQQDIEMYLSKGFKVIKITNGIIGKTLQGAIAVYDFLEQAQSTYVERNKYYGDSYKNFGDVVKALFPNGIELKTVEDMNRWGVFQTMLSKLHRYANNFHNGGHEDSLLDLVVYSAMLNELDKK